MRGRGWSAVPPTRAAGVGPTWLPSPSTKRPPLQSARSQAAAAVAVGERAKATATLVPTWRRLVGWIAAAASRYGSRRTSRTQTASQPAASARSARRAASAGWTAPGKVRPILICPAIVTATHPPDRDPPPSGGLAEDEKAAARIAWPAAGLARQPVKGPG